ncbi:MAG TPA: hypothetical protein VF796_27860 [Humisphaera sp.]
MDIRTPIGAMFATLGIVLAPFGLLTFGQGATYERSLGININLWWGLVMLAFGSLMLLAARRSARRVADPPVSQEDPTRPRGH